QDVLILDNRDSFTYNLAHRLFEVGASCGVGRSDQLTISAIEQLAPQSLVISPGPGHPNDAGISVDAVRVFGGTIPILGVCLGHQAIGVAYGGRVSENGHPFHGKATNMTLQDHPLFDHMPATCAFARYHSLSIERPLPSELSEIGTGDGMVMAVAHRTHRTFGVQFHPESVLSEHGTQLLRNFLGIVRQNS
ncbi:MAG: aminodeoxychorismate/anthranilate synthase component II, partial [bacterium]